MFSVLERECALFPSEAEFLTGVPHMSNNADHKDKLHPVVRAFATHKMHYLGELRQVLEGVSLDDNRRFFCRAFPNLQPASGGERVEYVDRAHPAWTVLRERWSVETVPDFLKHLFNKHDGEARLIGEAAWVPLDGDVRNQATWIPFSY